jgi:putative glycosyltransferase (TIGR04348 family)
MPRILIVAPLVTTPHSGNRVTAARYARHFRELGHRVRVRQVDDNRPADLLIALHACRTASATRHFANRCPQQPRVVVLTGTDLYRDLRRHKAAWAAIELASRLVVFHKRAVAELPARWRVRSRVITKSARPPAGSSAPLKRSFEFCVSGHLRSVKDPFRAALAVRRLPAESKILLTHVGAALSEAQRQRAVRELEQNPRYRYLGELPHGRARQLVARSRALIVSSKIEGAANVIAEAIVAGVPVLASRIPGNVGMLGEDWPGYFDFGDTRQLSALLRRCETDGRYYRTLRSAATARAPWFRPARERAALEKLVQELLP